MSLFQEIKAHKFRALKTLIFYLGYLTTGLCASMKGPALLDLQLLTSSTIEEVTRILPAEALGFILGSIFCATTITFIDGQILIISGLFFLGVSGIAIPYLQSALFLCLNTFIFGIFSGFIHTAGNAWFQNLWDKAAPPFMQALHFCFGLGALVGPLIVQPYLLPLNRDENSSELMIVTMFNASVSTALNTYTPDDVRIGIPYGISGGLNVVTAIAFAMVFLYKPKDSPHPSSKWVDSDENKTFKVPSTVKKSLLVVFTCVFMLMYWALELGNGYLLATYAVKSKLHLSKASASLLTSAFWAFFTFFRCSTVFIVDIVGCQNVITFDMTLVMIANFIFLCLSRSHEWALWLAVFIMGSGLSSVFAAMLGFLAETIPVTSRITSLLMVSASFGSFIVPQLVGSYVDEYPEVFLILNTIAGLGCTLLFGLMVLIKSTLKSKK